MEWREKVDPAIKVHLEKQVAESVKDRKAYEEAPDPGNAQLWVAVANLSKEIFNLNLRFSYFEKTLQEISKMQSVKKRVDKKKPKAL